MRFTVTVMGVMLLDSMPMVKVPVWVAPGAMPAALAITFKARGVPCSTFIGPDGFTCSHEGELLVLMNTVVEVVELRFTCLVRKPPDNTVKLSVELSTESVWALATPETTRASVQRIDRVKPTEF
jgi:hypothetical protein